MAEIEKRRKDPGVAALLSVFVTGLGQIYNEQVGKGLLFMVIQAINVALMALLIGFITFPILWVWAIWDAKIEAERLNMG